MLDTAAPASSAVVAFVTAVHAALLVVHLQRARSVMRLAVSVPAVAFGVLAWVLSTPAWLAAGVVANAGWAVIAAFTASRSPRAVPGAALGPATRAPHADTTDSVSPSDAAAPLSFVEATVLAVVPETETVRTFRLARPRGFDFAPGQFLMVRLEGDGATHARCYSISSSPGVSGYLEFSVRRQGRASALLHDRVRPGSRLLVHPPLGRFTVPGDHDGDLVLIAGGIGITPLVSILRHTLAAQPLRRVALLYSVRSARDVPFHQELEWLATRHPQLRLVLTVTGPADEPGCRRGRIDEALLREAVHALVRPMFFICGPGPMIDGVRGLLHAIGVRPGFVRFEAFEAAAAMAANGTRVAGPCAPCRLRLSRSGREIDVQAGETLLEAAERAGAAIASFCRAGVCGTCRTRLLAGEAPCSAEALSDEDRRRGFVLPCVAVPGGDCVLEA
jgi:ferredoxin-NADP reductase